MRRGPATRRSRLLAASLGRLFWAAVFSACARGGSGTGEARQYQGVIELHERVLAFEVAGRVRELRVRRGERAADGQILAVLDDGLERPLREAKAAEARAADAQLELLRSGARQEDVRAAEAQLRGAKAAEATLTDALERMRKLRAGGTVPPSQLEETQGLHERAVAERQAAEERLASLKAGARSQEVKMALARSSQAHAALDAEEARLARFVLRAGIAGEVLDTHVEPGEVVQPGTPVATLGETRRPYLDVFVPQGELAGVRPGAKASVRVDASAERFHGAIEMVGHTVEFTPRYLFSDKERPNLVVRVRIALEDPGEKLHAGVPAFAEISR